MWFVLQHAAWQNIQTRRSKLQGHKDEYKKGSSFLCVWIWLAQVSSHSLSQDYQNNHAIYKTWSFCHPSTVVIRQSGRRVRSSKNFSLLLIGEWHKRKRRRKKLLFVNHCPAHPTDVGRTLKTSKWCSHSCEHDISFATYTSGYHQGLEIAVS